jgi:aryl-alcohol dehydrogenase-like predicted oxidoreductase
MFSRREFIGTSLGAGAALALAPELLRAHGPSAGTLLHRAVPSTGEMLPVIGLGRGSRPADPAALREAVKTLVDNGGRVLDMTAGGTDAQDASAAAAHESGVRNKIFWSPPASTVQGRAPVKEQVEASFARLKVPQIDLVMLVAVNTTEIAEPLAVLSKMKKEGRVRYIGVTDLLPPRNMNAPVAPTLVSIMRNEPIDFVGLEYSVADRRAEQTLLPLAQERKLGVLTYYTFDRGRLFNRVGTTPLPEWAAEFDAKTWAQFFLKYVISHPAVTVARTGTTKAAHMLENIGGGIGRLPDEGTRKRMAEFVDSLPPRR